MTTPLLTDYTRIADTQEASELLFLWAGLSGVSTLLAKQVYLPFGNAKIYPNLYVMFLGDPGTRKSTVIKDLQKKLVKLNYLGLSGDKTSMQKYLCDLAGTAEDGNFLHEVSTTCESAIVIDEFADFIGINNYPFVALLGDFWDRDREYQYRLKNGTEIRIPPPIVNVLGGTTSSQFNTIFPPAIAEQGFLSRLLVIGAPRTSKKFSRPQQTPESLNESVLEKFAKVRELKGEMKFGDSVWDALDSIYKSWKPLTDTRFSHYSTRRHTQLLKLVMAVAASECRLEATIDDVIFANTLLCYTEYYMPDAIGYFGRSGASDVATKIINELKSSLAPITDHKLYANVSRDISHKDYLQLMQNLLMADKIQLISDKGYMLHVKPIKDNSCTHFDLNYLKPLLKDLH